MIFLNSELVSRIRWKGSLNCEAGEIVRDFLAGECDLLKLARVQSPATRELQVFLDNAAGRPICVECSVEGDLLVRAIGSSQSLYITGRTAEVISAYLDQAPVTMEERSEMTIRRYTPFRLLSN